MSHEMGGGNEARPLAMGSSASLRGGEDSQNDSHVKTSEEDSDAFQVNSEMAPAGPKQLPFEFRALETCIESACRCLESETSTLEEEAYPVLDALTSQLITLNLERVADELENFLGDDNDMAEMYLTQKLNSRLFDQASLKEEYNSESDDTDQSDESNSENYDKLPGLN